MVGKMNVRPTIGVSNLEEATGFYGGVLGLKMLNQNPYEITYQSGDSQLDIYLTDYAGTNKATYATWEVDDIEKEVADLSDNGVKFERYEDMEGVVLQGDIHLIASEKAAWFKDPDGNILCLHQ